MRSASSSLPRSTCLASDFSRPGDHRVGRGLRTAPQHHLDARLGRDLGDAAAHDPRTDDSDPLGHSCTAPRGGKAARLPTGRSGSPRGRRRVVCAPRWRTPIGLPRARSRSSVAGSGATHHQALDRRLSELSGVGRRRGAADRGGVRAPGADRRRSPQQHFAPLGVDDADAAGAATGATRRTPPTSKAVARREVHLPRRRLADAPALGAQGLRALRGDARRVPRRRGGRRVGCRRHGAVRPDGRPAWRCVHGGPRLRGGPRGLPVPRHRGRPPPRALDRPEAAGGDPRRGRRRDRARARARTRPGPSPAPASSRSTAPTARRATRPAPRASTCRSRSGGRGGGRWSWSSARRGGRRQDLAVGGDRDLVDRDLLGAACRRRRSARTPSIFWATSSPLVTEPKRA